MANLAAALKEEIRRLARKEVKAQTESTTQAVARYRREIAQLKRQLREQQKKIAFQEKQERQRLRDEFGLPVCDVIRHGPDELAEAIVQFRHSHGWQTKES